MNFLAHSHLSGNNNDVLFGNFIADAVKGNGFTRYSKDVQTGIKLHRKIDTYTDKHPIFKQTLNRIRSDFGKYAGVAADIYYDHYLAKNWKTYHQIDLKQFAGQVYTILRNNYSILPDRTKRLLPFLVMQNWLVGYSNFHDLQLVFYGMDRRTGFKSGMSKAVKVLRKNYLEIGDDFAGFYPQLFEYAEKTLLELNNDSDQW